MSGSRFGDSQLDAPRREESSGFGGEGLSR